VEFAITFKGDIPLDRTVALCKQAEVAGFDYAWFFDSHVLWRECYTTMAVCMRETKKLRFGPCVSNPLVRDWTVAASVFANMCDISEGRFDLGVGRGDSSRRLLGFKPSSLEEMQEFTDFVKTMVAGKSVTYHGKSQELPWTHGHQMPAWVAAYGPKALAMAGKHADGLVLQIGDPWLVKWFADQAKEAVKVAGRPEGSLRIMSAAPVWIGNIEKCREQTRWFPAMVGNHVADLVERYGREGGSVPKRLTDYIEGRKGYDYKHHADKDADHLDFISNEVVDSFSVLGPIEDHLAKLKELEAAGVTQFNIYLMCGDEERIVAEYAQHIIPHFKRATATV
jgi:probable F420-dependent oxidoreductase